ISLMSGVSIDSLKGAKGADQTGLHARSASRSALKAVIINSLAFNLGLSVIFLALGTAAGWIGAAITSNIWVRLIGGLIIFAFGLQLIGILKIGALYKDTRFFSNDKPRSVTGTFVLGLAFAAGWTPCIGPILGGIIGLAATSGGWKSGLILSAFYSAGLSIPFLITGLFINHFLGFYAGFRKHLHKVEVVSGVMLLAIGVLVASGNVARLSSFFAALPNPESWVSSKITPAGESAITANNSFTPVPDVELKTLDGKPFLLSDLHGRVVLVNFWATWCIPCRQEIPAFNAMTKELGPQGLEVVGIAADDTVSDIVNFQGDLKQDYHLVLGEQNVKSKFGGILGLPVTFVIDREGRIRQRFDGERNRASFEAAIKPLLNEDATIAKTE
ncbi:MAG: cytochrome c biogenesis protein CcdA, partial [Pyrinomonadaceae bacterium]